MILEPIDLLKQELKKLEKCLLKATVSNYFQVKENVDPYIKKYEEAIGILERSKTITDPEISQGCPFDDDCYNPNTPYLDNTQMPRECVKCGKWNQEICNTCPIINPQHEPV